MLDLWISQHNTTRGASIGLAGALTLRLFAARGNAAIGVFGQADDFLLGYIASNDKNGVFGRVEPAIVSERVFTIQTFDFVHETDDRLAIGMMREQR